MLWIVARFSSAQNNITLKNEAIHKSNSQFTDKSVDANINSLRLFQLVKDNK